MLTKINRPFLKWPGGKQRLLTHILPKLPPGNRLIEPFVGAGAIFLNTDYPEYYLNDINKDLISLYNFTKTNITKLIADSRDFFCPKNNNKKQYYKLREDFNYSSDKWLRACLFIYLNKHGYNGLCRYNQSGKYNVPFGSYKNPSFPEQELLHFANKASKSIFFCLDFNDFLKKFKKSAVIYCDPPYSPVSKTANFTSYSGTTFCDFKQQQLAKTADSLSNKGHIVIVSNHDTKYTRNLYQEARLFSYNANRMINCNIKKRGMIKELLAVFSKRTIKSKGD